MIKLIACDMDGTLLDDRQRLNEGIFDLIYTLQERGVAFAIASGRQSLSLMRAFADLVDKLYFIAENGAFVLHGRKEIVYDIIHKDLIRQFDSHVKDFDVGSVYFSKYCGYTRYQEIIDEFTSDTFSIKLKYIDNIANVEEDILKFSLKCEPEKWNQMKDGVMEPFGKKLRCAVSGYGCVDFMNIYTNKGVALQKLQQLLNISKEETLVFGDNYNDIEMFETAAYSYAMKNATDDVKKFAKFVTEKNNNENGVLHAINALYKENIL